MPLDTTDDADHPPKHDHEVLKVAKPFEGFGPIPLMTDHEKEVFNALRLYSKTVAGPLTPSPAHLGDSVGQRPVRIGGSASWPDTVTAALDSASPHQRMALLGRLWLLSRDDYKRLNIESPRYMASVSTPGRGDWDLLRSGVDIIDLMIGLDDYAKSLGLTTLDDAGVLALVRATAK